VRIIKSLTEVNTGGASAGHVPVTMLLLILIAALMVGAVWQKVKIGTMNADIDALKHEINYLKETKEKATARKLNLLSDYRIEQYARTELQLTFPPYDVIDLNADQKKQLKKLEFLLNQ
jgi:cell division protein FtsL